jgi:hypothetical protein
MFVAQINFLLKIVQSDLSGPQRNELVLKITLFALGERHLHELFG